MKNQPFIIPLFGLVLGILFAEFNPFQNWANYYLYLLYFLVLILCIFAYYFRFYSLLIFLLFVRMGSFLSEVQNHHQPLSNADLKTEKWVKVRIVESYKSSEKFRKYKVELLAIDSTPISRQNLLLYWQKENPLVYSQDEIWVKTEIQHLPKPLNPHQFDYAKYLRRKKIHYVCFAKESYEILPQKNSLFHQIARYKKDLHEKLQSTGYSKHSADLIGAILLGDRTEMDEEVQENYRKTGVVHILSISGLHIMIVYSIFYLLLFPISYLKNGKLWRILLSLSLIWSFVVFVGFQPPILRSALMILVYHITVSFRRKPSIYHTLAVSALILLVFNTNFLFDVGFQLSYAAVFFIVILHPVYQKLFKPRHYFTRLIVGFVGTCISAQLGTFPIAAYYFHQTSGLFLAGNVVMVMASYLMIAGGMVSVLLAGLNVEFTLWIKLFNAFIHYCNKYMEWLSGFKSLVFENISLQLMEVFVLLIGIVFMKFLLQERKFQWALPLLILFAGFQLNRKIQNQKFLQKKEIIVFHQYKNSIIGIRNGKSMDVYVKNLEDSMKIQTYILKPFTIKERIKTLEIHPYENLNQKSFQVDSLQNYILIQNNELYYPKEAIADFEIIADGSNYPNFIAQMDLPVWNTYEKGAKIIELR